MATWFQAHPDGAKYSGGHIVNCPTRWSLLLLIGYWCRSTTQITEKYSTAMCYLGPKGDIWKKVKLTKNLLKYFLSETIHIQDNGSRVFFCKICNSKFLKSHFAHFPSPRGQTWMCTQVTIFPNDCGVSRARKIHRFGLGCFPLVALWLLQGQLKMSNMYSDISEYHWWTVCSFQFFFLGKIGFGGNIYWQSRHTKQLFWKCFTFAISTS